MAPHLVNETSHILLKPKVHYRVQKSPQLVPIMHHINQIHGSLFHFLNIYFTLLPSMPRSSKGSLFPQTLHAPSLLAPNHTTAPPAHSRTPQHHPSTPSNHGSHYYAFFSNPRYFRFPKSKHLAKHPTLEHTQPMCYP